MVFERDQDMKLRIGVAVNGRAGICLLSWIDSDFAADKVDRNFVKGGVVTMDGAFVQWICKKQTGVSLSTMEAESEFISSSDVVRELKVLRELLSEIGFQVEEAIKMLMDN